MGSDLMIGAAVDTLHETPEMMAYRVMAGYLPKVAERMERVAAAGVSPDRDAVAMWLMVYGPDVRNVLDSDPTLYVLEPAEIDAIVDASAYAAAHLPGELDAAFVTEFATNVARVRADELTPAPEPAKPQTVQAKPNRRKPVKDRTRQVRVCADVTDRRGHVIVPEGMIGTALDWPWFGAARVEFTNRHGQTYTVSVLRSDLAEVDG